MREKEQDFEEKTEVGEEGGSMFHFCCCDQNALTKSILGARACLAYNSRLYSWNYRKSSKELEAASQFTSTVKSRKKHMQALMLLTQLSF